MNVEKERFWSMLKQSMINFYAIHKQHIILPFTLDFSHVESYAIDVMKVRDTYHAHILLRNIKRYERLFGLQPTIVYMLLHIFEKNPECHYLYKNVDILVHHNLFEPFILFAIQHNKPNILDRLRVCIDIVSYLYKVYGVHLYPNTSGIKMIKAVKTIIKKYGRSN